MFALGALMKKYFSTTFGLWLLVFVPVFALSAEECTRDSPSQKPSLIQAAKTHYPKEFTVACSSTDFDKNKAIIFHEPVPTTQSEAEARVKAACSKAGHDSATCAKVVTSLFAGKQSSKEDSFQVDLRFCDEASLLLLYAATENDALKTIDPTLIQEKGLIGALSVSKSGTLQTAKSSGDSYLCTALFKNGALPKEIWEGDIAVGNFIHDTWWLFPAMVGYELWAKPLASSLPSHPWLFDLVEPMVGAWARQMAWLTGTTHPEALPSALGFILLTIFFPANYVLGLFVLMCSGALATLGLTAPTCVTAAIATSFGVISITVAVLLGVVLPQWPALLALTLYIMFCAPMKKKAL